MYCNSKLPVLESSYSSDSINMDEYHTQIIKETGRICIVWYILQSICTSHLVTVATPNKIARDKANGFALEAIQNQLITPDMWSNANNTKQKHDPVSFHWDTPHTRSTVQYKQKSTRYSPMGHAILKGQTRSILIVRSMVFVY
eukprot:83707_1